MAEKFFNQPYFNNIDYSLDNVTNPVNEQVDYSGSIDPKKILKDPRFLQDLRDYYEEREGRNIHWSDEALIDAFYSDSTWRELNTVSAIGGAFEPWGMGTESRERAKRIESVWQQLPMFWQEGGRGAATALPDIAGALISDPLNLIPVGAAFNTAKAGVIAGKTALGAVARGTGKAALYEGGISGAQEGIVNTASQARDIQLGLQEGFSKGELATSVGLGATIGGVAGGALGIPSALAGAGAGQQTVQSLLAKGLTREQIAALSPDALAKSGDVNVYGQPPVEQADEVIPETTEEVVPQPKITIDQLIEAQKTKIDDMAKGGADIDEENTILAILQEVKNFDDVIEPKATDYINKLESVGSEIARKKAVKERIALNNLKNIVENIKKGEAEDFEGDLEAILSFLKDNAISKKVRSIPTDDPSGPQVVSPPGTEAETAAPETAAPETAAPETDTTQPKRNPIEKVVFDTIEEETANRAAALKRLGKQMTEEVYDMLDEAGLNPEEVAKEGGYNRKKLTVDTAKRRIEQFKKTQKFKDEILIEGQDEFDNLMKTMEVTTGNKPTDETRASLARAFEQGANDKKLIYPKNTIKIDTDLDKLADSMLPEREWIAEEQLTPDEIKQYKKILQRFKNQAAKAPEGSPLKITKVVEAKARVAFRSQRKNVQGKARTTGESIERAGERIGAGRVEDGKIQGILKKTGKSGVIGRTPGRADNTKYADREKAYSISKEARRDSPNRLVAFYNNSAMRAIDETGKEVKAPIGSKLYADGYTRKVFLNKEAAFKRTGLNAPDGEDTARLIGQATKEVKQDKLPRKLNNAEAIEEGLENGDVEKLLEILRRVRDGTIDELPENQTTIQTPDANVAPVTRGDKRLIVQNKNNPDDVRIISKKQVADGKGIEAIIGQKGGPNSDPSNWTVKYAPADTKAFGPKLKELFESLPDEQGTPSAGSRVEAGGATGNGEPIDIKEANNLQIFLNEEDLAFLTRYNELARQLVPMGGSSPLFEIPTMPKSGSIGIPYESVREIMLFLSQAAKWSKTRKGHQELIDVFKGFMEMENRVLPPEGFIDSTASRQKTINNLEKIFSGYDTDEIAAARRLLERLGGNPELGPRITATSVPMRANYYTTTGATTGLPTVNILPKSDVASGLAAPMNVKLLHEVAHWAFDNILTSKDKLEFLNLMSKYYADFTDRLDVNKLDEGSFTSTTKPEFVQGESFAFANSLDSPGEFFANQFAAWAGRTDSKLVIKDETFWQKVTGYVKATFDRFFYSTPIDSELEPFFLKILPNKEEIGKRSLGTHTPKTKAGKAALEKHEQLNKIFTRLEYLTQMLPEEIISPNDFITSFTEDMWFLANMVTIRKKQDLLKWSVLMFKGLLKKDLKT
jgi:hypothetical protein